jgi:plasmid stabilization system protein ParE
VKVWLSPEAEADLQATLEFIHERNPTAAIDQMTTGESVRSWVIPPFRIYYQRRQDALLVLRIYHHSRRPIAK